MEEQEKIDLLKFFAVNPSMAHKYLFPTRRENETPRFHEDIIAHLHSTSSLTGLQAFRGAAKTTLVEEYVILEALFARHKYILIIGSTYTNAVKILSSIKNQLMMNDRIGELFGWQESQPWTADVLVLKNGVRIEALGAGQAMRGAKFNESRPSLAVVDDLEDEDSAATKIAREKIYDWFFGVLLPALHPTKRQIKLIGTPIHPEALIEKIFSDPSWSCKKFPIVYIDSETGKEVSAWEDRFPMQWVNDQRNMLHRQGRSSQFAREYMCTAEDEDTKPFKRPMIHVNDRYNPYSPKYVVCDPARTVNQKTSARTGYVCASWEGNNLKVIDAIGAFHMPNEIIDTLFDWNNRYKPVVVGVESNALDEFIRQPLRNEMLRRHVTIPLQDLRAPKDKDLFIRGLQPFYSANMVTHVKALPDLENELMGYPTGRRDVVNALAYLLMLRPGNPVYTDFTERNVHIGLQVRQDKQRYLIVACRPAMTAMVIAQLIDGVVYIVHDMVRHAPATEVFEYMYQEAIQLAGEVKLVVPQDGNDVYLRYGINKLNLQSNYTKPLGESEGRIREYLQKSVRGEPAFIVNDKAIWAINGMVGGYCRRLDRDGSIHDSTVNNEYQLIIGMIESWVASLDTGANIGYSSKVNYATTKTGQRYLTTRPK